MASPDFHTPPATVSSHGKKLPSISAFFPAYNDGGTIASMVVTTLATLRECAEDFEVIVVNDGSADYTGALLDELAQTHAPHLRVIHHPRNRGYGAALRTGFAAATREWVFYTDGDAQYNPQQLRLLVDAALARQAAGERVDVVNGYKICRQDPWYRVVIGRIYHHVVKLMFGFKLRDVDCDFRLIRREIFERVALRSDSGTICLEMVKKFQDAGCVFVEVPVNHFHRAFGRSQFFNFSRLWRTAVQLLSLWRELIWRRSSSKPSITTGAIERSGIEKSSSPLASAPPAGRA
ncbi:MAG: glycosyltransferase family 2 protein [Verrucomicrobia bacterium]|nr:glycosyltransferase family 2 protein [Verrucomicrobiota bacterium]MBV9658870.1 glycosyltransferase family 2 protein [Verrucomicrobiota bacterium]